MLIWFLDKSEEEKKIIDLDKKISNFTLLLFQLFSLYVWEKLHSKSELLQKSSYYIFWFIAKLW